MDPIALFLLVVMAGVAGLLLVVSFVSWYRIRHLKLAFVFIAFIIFFCKAILLLIGLLAMDEKGVIIDVAVLVLLYFAVVKR